MKRRSRPQADTLRHPEAERAFLAGLVELVTDDPARCLKASRLVEPDALTIEAGPDLLLAIREAALLEGPTLADVTRIIRERTIDAPPDGHPEPCALMIDLAKAARSSRGGYSLGVFRHAVEIVKAAARRRTIEAASIAAEVAADPQAEPAEIEAAGRAVAEAVAAGPTDGLEWEPFPVALLPEPAGSFVAETAAGLGADPSLVALPMLASVAAMIGNRRRIEIWPGWQEPAIVWAAAVCDSGSMKSPAADKVLRFVRERQKAAMADHRAALAAWEQAKREHDAAKRSRSAAADAPPERPQAERLVIDDLTIEALAPILDANPRGVLLDRDELSGWIEGFDRYAPGGRGGAEVGRWLSVYNAGPITVDRKLSGTVYVPAALVSIFGGIQPRILARAAGQRHFDNGLVPRFMLAAPPRRRKTLPGDGAGFATEAATADMFSTLAALPPGPDGGPEVLDLEPEALAEYRAYWQALAVEQFEAAGPEASMLSKAEAWAARLALVCHLIRQAGSEPALRSRIDVDSIRRGIGLARWASREWRRVFAALEAGGVGSDDRALREWIAARGGVASPRDVARGLSQYRAPGRAEAACQRLTKGGAAEWVASATGGRPADAVRLK